MPFNRLVISQSLVMSAALAVFGCAGADTDTEGNYVVPSFVESGNGAPATTRPPAADGADEGMSSQPNPTGTSEGQNANALPIAPANTNGASSPAAVPGNTANAPPNSNGMTAGNGQTGNGQSGNGQTGNGPGNGMGTGNPATTAPPPPYVFPPLDCGAPAPTVSGGTQACSVNAGGTVQGQRWFMWYSGSGGCMTPYPDGGFKATWNNSGDFLARMGQQWNETQTFDQLGTIGADLAFTKTGTGGGYSFIGIYGWSNNPLVEYYIVENSFGTGPATPYATTQRGTFNVDGATYKIFSGTKTNQPSLHGTATFQQFFSVRQTPRECGHVSITEHFKQWQGLGMNLGKMSEARVLVEAGGGSGSITFTSAHVTVTRG